jgi:hypothetical protein
MRNSPSETNTMTAITLEPAVVDALRKANGPAEILDVSGAVVGVFAPVPVATATHVRRKVRTPEEEAALLEDLERRAQDPRPGITFRQMFERLLSLATDPIDQAVLRRQIERFAERE